MAVEPSLRLSSAKWISQTPDTTVRGVQLCLRTLKSTSSSDLDINIESTTEIIESSVFKPHWTIIQLRSTRRDITSLTCNWLQMEWLFIPSTPRRSRCFVTFFQTMSVMRNTVKLETARYTIFQSSVRSLFLLAIHKASVTQYSFRLELGIIDTTPRRNNLNSGWLLFFKSTL